MNPRSSRPTYLNNRPYANPDSFGQRLPYYAPAFQTQRYGYPPTGYMNYGVPPQYGHGYTHDPNVYYGPPVGQFTMQGHRPRRPHPYPNPYHQPQHYRYRDSRVSLRMDQAYLPLEFQHTSNLRGLPDQNRRTKPVMVSRGRGTRREIHSSAPVSASEPQTAVTDSSSEEDPAPNGACQTPEPANGPQAEISSTMIITPYRTIDGVDYNLREKLIYQLRHGQYQCLICISRVRQRDAIWSCSTCFHIYHLSCIKSWAEKCKATAAGEESDTSSQVFWRCPACQTKQVCDGESKDRLPEYVCFCGRVRNPEYHPARTSIPHGCDEVCGKLRTTSSQKQDESTKYLRQTLCTHPCTELCHPGPCPPCVTRVSMTCPCGRIQRSVACGDTPPAPCGQLCSQTLSEAGSSCACGIHTCLYGCHTEQCPPCPWQLEIACFCGREEKTIICGSEDAKKIDFTPNVRELVQIAAVEFRSLELTLIASENAALGMDSVHDQTSFLSEELNAMALSTPAAKAPPTPGDGKSEETPAPAVLLLNPPVVKLGSSFSCSQTCGKQLSCGNHTCLDPCHSGDCKPCALEPTRCFTCPCGRVALSKLVSSGNVSGDRVSCIDPVPLCPNVCSRPHAICGHPCPLTCHSGPCPPCELSTTAKCRCGRTSKELTCVRFEELANTDGLVQMLCEKVCKRKKVCGRHKCNKKCCDLIVHPCSEICGRRLTCQQHNCEEPCHPGPCATCWRGVIYTELYCRCGLTVLHPPQPCGSAGPECLQPCNRVHDCDHPVRHNCHNDPTCPPCTVLLTKECPGGHGVQFSMPCFQPVLSCGRVCGKQLPRCSHTCQRPCHIGDCIEPATPDQPHPPYPCTQPCQKPRPDCGHPCKLPCHEAKGQTCLQAVIAMKRGTDASSGRPAATFPPCQHRIELVCSCGRRKEKQSCHQVQLKKCILAQQNESSGEIHTSTKLNENAEGPLKLLACDETCTKAEQASKAAEHSYADTLTWKRGAQEDLLGMPGAGPASSNDTETTLPELPEYSDFLRQYALSNFTFAVSVERQFFSMLTELWKPAEKQGVPPVRVLTHHFPPMNKKRRRFIRELAEFYGIECYTVDPEPSRHVLVLAKRGEARLPGKTSDHRACLTNSLQRDFSGTVHIREGIRVPKQPEKKTGLPPPSNMGMSYAQILRRNCSQ